MGLDRFLALPSCVEKGMGHCPAMTRDLPEIFVGVLCQRGKRLLPLRPMLQSGTDKAIVASERDGCDLRWIRSCSQGLLGQSDPCLARTSFQRFQVIVLEPLDGKELLVESEIMSNEKR